MPSDHMPQPLGRVLLTGATGMVGSSVLAALLEDDSVSKVITLGRRNTGRRHPKLEEIMFTGFGDSSALVSHLKGIDTVFHCLATYSARVSRQTYKEITVDWLAALLGACECVSPDMTFCLFSAQGARPDGGGMSFALRLKGRAESVLFSSGVARKFAFRPGYIAPSGPRNTWKIADYFFKPLQRLMPSIGVTSDELALAMIMTATGDLRDSGVLENSDIRDLLA